jgi:hypothetical protein
MTSCRHFAAALAGGRLTIPLVDSSFAPAVARRVVRRGLAADDGNGPETRKCRQMAAAKRANALTTARLTKKMTNG